MSETPTPAAPSQGRFPLLVPAELAPEQASLYAAIAGPPRADGPFRLTYDDGALTGPFNALLFAPAIGQAVQELGAVLRFRGSLNGRLRELVICTLAAELESDYEWYAHSRVALTAGVSATELEELGSGRLPATLDSAEHAALDLVRALLDSATVSERVHAAAAEHFDHAGITELTVLTGYYRLLAGLLAVGAVPAPTEPGHGTTHTRP